MKKIIILITILSLTIGNLSLQMPMTAKAETVTENVEQENMVSETEDESVIVSEDDETEDLETEEDEVEDSNEIEISTNIIAKWEHHYNAEVTIKNISKERIDDWEVSFDFADKIEHIWCAEIKKEENGFYTIRNVDWNQDIEQNEIVTFGMTVYYEEKIGQIENYYLTRTLLPVDSGYDVNYQQFSRWDNKVNGQITITNQSDKRIEDWKLGLTTNLDFEQVWNAEQVKDDEEEMFDNKGYNENIEPGQSVTFGFIASCDDESVELYSDTLYQMVEIPEELEGNPDWVSEYELNEIAKYEFEPEDFETEEDYQEYVAARKALGYEITTSTYDREEDDDDSDFELYPAESNGKMLAKAKLKKPKALKLTNNACDCKIINAGEYGIQSFYKSGNSIYLTQRIGDSIKITKCPKRKAAEVSEKAQKIWSIGKGDTIYDMEDKKKEEMTLVGFHHGQTLELFTYGKKTYMLVTAGRAGGKKSKIVWGDRIAILKFMAGKKINFDNLNHEKTAAVKYVTNLAYANKKRVSGGKVTHVEAALSENKKTLLLWAQMAKSSKGEGMKVQLACYRMSNVMGELIKVEKKARKKKKSANLSCKNIAKKNCICSAIQSEKQGNLTKPYGSFQSIDMSNQVDGQYKIFISGGNEAAGMKCSIAMCTITKKGKSEYLYRRKILSSIQGLSKKKEMEGMHYQNGKITFIMTAANKEKIKYKEKDVKLGKRTQVMFSIEEKKVYGR